MIMICAWYVYIHDIIHLPGIILYLSNELEGWILLHQSKVVGKGDTLQVFQVPCVMSKFNKESNRIAESTNKGSTWDLHWSSHETCQCAWTWTPPFCGVFFLRHIMHLLRSAWTTSNSWWATPLKNIPERSNLLIRAWKPCHPLRWSGVSRFSCSTKFQKTESHKCQFCQRHSRLMAYETDVFSSAPLQHDGFYPVDVSENWGTPKWMVYSGKPY